MDNKEVEKKIQSDNFCFKYNKADTVLVSKAIGSFLYLLLMLLLTYKSYFIDDDIGVVLITSMFSLAFIWIIYTQLHRRLSYDEICIEDKYFIVKNKNNIKSKTLINDINCTSHTSVIAMWDNVYK